jgi:hypothetical protein
MLPVSSKGFFLERSEGEETAGFPSNPSNVVISAPEAKRGALKVLGKEIFP